MKAILVVDIPKEFENREPYVVEGGLFCYIDNPYTKYRYISNIARTELKPLPQKKELEESGNSLIDDCKEYYIDGWNDCIDELLGGEQ